MGKRKVGQGSNSFFAAALSLSPYGGHQAHVAHAKHITQRSRPNGPHSQYQQTTPTDAISQLSESVRIIDPRHSLYGRGFPLLRIVHKPRQPSLCVIEFQPEIHRVIPLAVTDLNVEPIALFPLPLDIASVQALLIIYQHISILCPEITKHVIANDSDTLQSSDEQSSGDNDNPAYRSVQPVVSSDLPAAAIRAAGTDAIVRSTFNSRRTHGGPA